MRLMNKPSTVVIIPFSSVQATPTRGRMPSTIERASIMETKLPPVIVQARLRIFVVVVLFAPEFMPGAADENIFKRRVAYRKRFDLTGKGLDNFRDKTVRAFALDPHLIFQHRRLYVKARPDAL